jgi:hypothetical protein
MLSKAIAVIPIIMHALIKSGTPLIPAFWTAMTNGEAAELELPSRCGSSDGTIRETRTTETR